MPLVQNVSTIIFIGGILAALPFYNYKTNSFYGLKLHSLLMSLIAVVMCCLSLYSSWKQGGFITVVQGGAGILFAISNISIFYRSAINASKYQEVFNTINSIDDHLSTTHHHEPKKISYVGLKICTAITFLLFLTIYDAAYFLLSPYPKDFVIFYTYERTYILFDIVFQHFILAAIKFRLETLENCIVAYEKKWDYKGRLKILIIIHKKICDVVIMFNDLCTWRNLLIILYVFVGVLKKFFYAIIENTNEFSIAYFVNVNIGQLAMIILGILCMALASPAYLSGTHWFLFVVTISFIGTLIWVFVYLLGVREALNLPIDWLLSELVNTGICTGLYLIAFIVQLAVWSRPYTHYRGVNIAAGVFGLFNTIAYGFGTYLLHKEWKSTRAN